MKKASEFQEHARECLALAEGMKPGEHRDQLLRMAETWESLARDRARIVRLHPELDERSAQGKQEGGSSAGSAP